jgi:uncharacterized protein (TIGR02001 family)
VSQITLSILGSYRLGTAIATHPSNTYNSFFIGDSEMKNGLLLTTTIVSSLFVSTQAMADMSANVSVTSNYLWRTQTQSAHNPAIQGGLDYSAKNGLYVGTWASSEKFYNADGNKVGGTEVDLYAGFQKELKNGLGYDVGAVKYNYPTNNSNEFTEAYGKLKYKGVAFEYYNTIQTKVSGFNQKGDQYYSLGYSHNLKNNWNAGAKVGRYDYKDNSLDYNHAQLTLTKSLPKAGDLIFTVEKTSKTGAGVVANGNSDAIATVTWKKTFNF